MRKIEGSWSGMRKYLEKEMLAPSLKGKVRYRATTYAGMDGDCIFEIYLDGKIKKRFSFETVNSYFIKNGLSKNKAPFGAYEYWEDFWENMQKYPIEKRTEYTDQEFASALEIYRNQSIDKSLFSKNPIVKMFAILDRRVGKNKLKNIFQSFDKEPTFLKDIYLFRIKNEFNI
ncbi:MAG: hypothetical protein PUG67_03025 [Peptoniphilaceae bacterium]|nr:hypothetical protein [Peptoniphilaceae bacterium]MDY6019227.1 hypothetical protein [Anaerococcus sp.]